MLNGLSALDARANMGNRTEPRNLGRAIAGALACALAYVGLALPASAPAAKVPAGFQQRTIASGLTSPTAVDRRPDGRTLVPGEQSDGLIAEVHIHKRALSANEVTTDVKSATATAARRRTFKSPDTGKACVPPGTTRNRAKLTRSLRSKKVKICADKPPKARR